MASDLKIRARVSPTGRIVNDNDRPALQNTPPPLTEKQREDAEAIRAVLRARTCAVCGLSDGKCPHCRFVWRP